MSGTYTQLKAEVSAGLGSAAGATSRVEPGHWRFALSDGRTQEVEARLEEDWLWLETGFDPPAGRSHWDLLCAGAGLPALARLVVVEPMKEPLLRVELPLDRGGDIAARVETARVRLDAAVSQLERERKRKRPGKTRPAPAVSPGTRHDLAELLRSCDRPFHQRPDGVPIVDLQAGRGSYRAELTDYGENGVQVAVPLGRTETLSNTGREALGLFLLTATAGLRMARAAVSEAGGNVTARLEVRLPATPSSAEIVHGLAALAAGCGLFGPETEALMEGNLAAHYLLVRGLASHEQNPVHAARRAS